MAPTIRFKVAADETNHLIRPAERQTFRNNQFRLGVRTDMRSIYPIMDHADIIAKRRGKCIGLQQVGADAPRRNVKMQRIVEIAQTQT